MELESLSPEITDLKYTKENPSTVTGKIEHIDTNGRGVFIMCRIIDDRGNLMCNQAIVVTQPSVENTFKILVVDEPEVIDRIEVQIV